MSSKGVRCTQAAQATLTTVNINSEQHFRQTSLYSVNTRLSYQHKSCSGMVELKINPVFIIGFSLKCKFLPLKTFPGLKNVQHIWHLVASVIQSSLFKSREWEHCWCDTLWPAEKKKRKRYRLDKAVCSHTDTFTVISATKLSPRNHSAFHFITLF